MTITVKRELAFTFSTIVLERHLEAVGDLNQRLASRILQHEQAQRGHG